MAQAEFTPEEQKTLDFVALHDKWNPETLEKSVRNEIQDKGTTFKKALIRVLAHVERPDDPSGATDRVAALKAKIERLKAQAVEDFKKNGGF